MEMPNEPVTNIVLLCERQLQVRDLAGFKKSHQVPSDDSEHTQAFVRRIAEGDIGADLDVRFAEFRRHFKFKRVDLRVQDPSDGFGAIVTPLFDYRVVAAMSSDDPGTAVIRSQVTNFCGQDVLLSPAFTSVFGMLFNSIEVSPPNSIHIETLIDTIEDQDEGNVVVQYDRSGTWCSLTIPQMTGELLVESDRILLRLGQAAAPKKLLDTFLRFREVLRSLQCY
ncbi:MAG: hypothetical protein WAO83_00710 [Fuerstiella sp.]